MFSTASSFARKLSVAIVVALLGGVLAPVATSTSASAGATPAPADGSYICTTGLLREGSDTSPTYTITNGYVSKGDNCAGAVVIPDGVTSIGYAAFAYATGLTSITIPSSVTSIGNYAFSYATGLTSITFAQGSQLTSIGGYAFLDATGLTSITIPSSVTSIGDYAFYGATGLTSITFAQGSQLTSIGGYAFEGATELTSITIPSSVTSIGGYAFYGASSLKDVYFAGNAPNSVGGDAFASIASAATAHISTTATGFGTEPTWNGLVIERKAITETVKATYASGVELSGTVEVGALLEVKPGTWSGTGPVSHKYQWYACKTASKKVLKTGKAAPQCTMIKNATKTSFKVTKKEKDRYLAVLITGTNRVGKSAIFTITRKRPGN